ncbi:MAG TPA: hypothetical protein VNZ58_04805 [Thermomicrobiales bacterium]|nr:hypothetical protein [Thermomicrobiales bacterium]
MSAITFWAAIAAISATIVIANSIFTSSRAGSTDPGQSLRKVTPDPQEQDRGKMEGGPDWARITQLVALAVLIISLIILIFLLWL